MIAQRQHAAGEPARATHSPQTYRDHTSRDTAAETYREAWLRRSRLKRVVALGALVVALSAGTPSHAESATDVAMAEGLFNEGVKLLEQKKYGEACDMLDRSRKLAIGLGVTLYLADCQESNNKPGTALALFREAEKMAGERKDARQQIAKERADKLEKMAARIVLRVSAEVTTAGQQVILDGRKMDLKDWAQPIVTDPGVHKVRSMSEDGNVWASEVTAVAGGTIGVDIPLLRPLRSGAPSTPSPPETSEPATPALPKQDATPAAPGKTQRTAGLITAGAGVLGLGLGAVFGIRAKSLKNDSNGPGLCEEATNKCTPQGIEKRDEALGSATLSTILIVLGGVAVAGGAVLYLTAPTTGKTAGIVLAPSLSAKEGGLIVRGTFE